ncbi:hypothetical protein HN51_015756 [Arachis hypogaea]
MTILDNNSQRNRYSYILILKNCSYLNKFLRDIIIIYTEIVVKVRVLPVKTTITNKNLTKRENSKDLNETKKYKYLWIECKNYCGLNYRKFLR